MAANETRAAEEIRYSRDLGQAQVASLGLRLGLAVLLFLSIHIVDTSTVELGPPRGTDTIDQPPQGSYCVATG